MASSSSRSVKVTDLNPHLLCVLCGGYYVDATTIIECLHSFCKSCIVRYLETNKYCPICDVQVHKSKPLLNIRSDRKLQAIVYKLVPGLFQKELNCRKEFYKNLPDAASAEDSPICPPGETLLLGVKFADAPPQTQNKRYLRCPAAITISLLQKLMRAKFDLSVAQRVEFLHEGDLLPDHMSLMDLAYMYHWKRKHPIELEYRLLECQQKKIKLSPVEDDPACVQEKQNKIKCCDKDQVVINVTSDQPDREVQLQISENGIMSVQSVNSSSDNTVLTSASETSGPVKDINLETMELVKSLGNEVTLTFDGSTANNKVQCEVKGKDEIHTNNNTINMESISEDHKDINCTQNMKEDTSKNENVSTDVNECLDVKENKRDDISVNNNDPDKNKSHKMNSSLSITVIPVESTTNTIVHCQKVYPGAVKDINHSRHFKAKEMSNDFKRPEVTIKPTSEKQEPPKSTTTARYKTLKSPVKPWNPTIPRSTIMAMKQAQAASQEKDQPGKALPKAPKFFKMRNVPRFLGNPASGVKPMYQSGSELPTQASQPALSQTSKSTCSSELTVMKIDPKTLNPITVPISKSSKLNSSSSKPPITYSPARKPSERDLRGGGTPIRNPVSKGNMPSRASGLAHSQSFPSNPFGLPSPHVLYPGFPRPFSQVDASGNQLSADSQILRAMSMLCSPGAAAFHSSLPPSISMLFNPHHPHHRSTPDKLNFKYNPSDIHKVITTSTPSVQRIPPSGPSSKIAPSSPNSSFTESLSSPSPIKEHEKHLAEEKSEIGLEELRRSGSFVSSNESKPKTTTSSCSTEQDSPQTRIGKISPLPITNGLSSITKSNLEKDISKLHKQNKNVNQSVKEITEQSSKEGSQRDNSIKAIIDNNSSS